MFVANTTPSGSTLSTPVLPIFELSNTQPSVGAATQTEQDSLSLTIVFGVLGLLAAVVGVSIAILQLRHMLRQEKTEEVYELACKSKTRAVVDQYANCP